MVLAAAVLLPSASFARSVESWRQKAVALDRANQWKDAWAAEKVAQQQAENSPMVQGVALVRSQLLEISGRFGITSIEALGQPFDPHLPEWLPDITVSNLHVGRAVVSLRFYRERDGGSSYEVLDKRGHLHVVRQPSPWSMTTGPIERVVDALASVLPGK